MNENDFPEEDLYAEEVDLDDFDPSSLNSLFAERKGNRKPKRPMEEFLLSDDEDIEEDALNFELDEPTYETPFIPPKQNKRPKPQFGSLAEPETDHSNPFENIDEISVFEPLEQEDAIDPTTRQPETQPHLQEFNEQEIASYKKRIGLEEETPTVDIETPKEKPTKKQKPEKNFKKLSLKEKIAAAKNQTQEKPIEIEKPEQKESKENFKKLSLKEKIAAAKNQTQEQTPTKKLSLKEKLTQGKAKQEAEYTEELPEQKITLSDEIQETEKLPTGLKGLKEKIAAAKQYDNKTKTKNKKLAGINISPPSLSDKLKTKINDKKTVENKQTHEIVSSRFEALLEPLTEDELARLHSVVVQEEPIFHKIEKAKKTSVRNQKYAAILSIIIFIFWLWMINPQTLLTETLPNASYPNWSFLTKINENILSGAMFALGVALPFVSILILTKGITYLSRLITTIRIDDAIIAILSISCAVGILKSVQSGFPVVALILTILWLIVYWIASILSGGEY